MMSLDLPRQSLTNYVMYSRRKDTMSIKDIRAEGLKSWFKELQEYNTDIKPLLIKYIGKDKIESIGDIQKLKEAMKLDGRTVLGLE